MNNAEYYFMSRAQRANPKRQKSIAFETTEKGGRAGSPWRHTKTGLRPDLGFSPRSGWEANIARILQAYDIEFEFEPYIFWFPVKRGNRGYTPDFFLSDTGDWLEVKGYFDSNSRIKLKRFKKYYPEEFAKLTMVIGKAKNSISICDELGIPYLFYPDIVNIFKEKIRNWE